MIEAAALIIQLKDRIDLYMQKASGLDLELLQFANLKSAEIVAKSLLTKCLPFETKEQLASYIAAKLNLGSKDEILTFIIRTCLITLQAHKDDLA